MSKKIDALIAAAQEERKNMNSKLDEIKTDFLEKIDKFVPDKEAKTESQHQNLFEKIKQEILELQNNIESNMFNIILENREKNKFEKNFEVGGEWYANSLSNNFNTAARNYSYGGMKAAAFFEDPRSNYYRNDFYPEKSISSFKSGKDGVKLLQIRNKGIGRRLEEKVLHKFANNLVPAR